MSWNFSEETHLRNLLRVLILLHTHIHTSQTVGQFFYLPDKIFSKIAHLSFVAYKLARQFQKSMFVHLSSFKNAGLLHVPFISVMRLMGAEGRVSFLQQQQLLHGILERFDNEHQTFFHWQVKAHLYFKLCYQRWQWIILLMMLVPLSVFNVSRS